VLELENMFTAQERVVSKRGPAGIDGMTIEELQPYLIKNYRELCESIRGGMVQTEAGEAGRNTETGWREAPVRSANGDRPDGAIGELKKIIYNIADSNQGDAEQEGKISESMDDFNLERSSHLAYSLPPDEDTDADDILRRMLTTRETSNIIPFNTINGLISGARNQNGPRGRDITTDEYVEILSKLKELIPGLEALINAISALKPDIREVISAITEPTYIYGA
jgi:hypothetical protein